MDVDIRHGGLPFRWRTWTPIQRNVAVPRDNPNSKDQLDPFNHLATEHQRYTQTHKQPVG